MQKVTEAIREIITAFVHGAAELKAPDPYSSSPAISGCSFCKSAPDFENNSKGCFKSPCDSGLEWEFCPECEPRFDALGELVEEMNRRLLRLSPTTVAVKRSSGELETGIWTCATLVPGEVLSNVDTVRIAVVNGKGKVKALTLAELEEAAAEAVSSDLSETVEFFHDVPVQFLGINPKAGVQAEAEAVQAIMDQSTSGRVDSRAHEKASDKKRKRACDDQDAGKGCI